MIQLLKEEELVSIIEGEGLPQRIKFKMIVLEPEIDRGRWKAANMRTIKEPDTRLGGTNRDPNQGF